MASSTQSTGSDFVIRKGKRGTTGTWAVILGGIFVVALSALIAALLQPSHFGRGGDGVGVVVLPWVGTIGCAAGVFLALSQWWDDELWFHMSGDQLEARRGTRKRRGRSTTFDRLAPVALVFEGGTGAHHVFAVQGEKRVLLGDAADLLPLQLSNWEAWARSSGMTVER